MTYWKHKQKLLLLIARLGGCQETHPRGAVLPSTDTERADLVLFYADCLPRNYIKEQYWKTQSFKIIMVTLEQS